MCIYIYICISFYIYMDDIYIYIFICCRGRGFAKKQRRVFSFAPPKQSLYPSVFQGAQKYDAD